MFKNDDKSLEYLYISINFSPKVQLLPSNGKLNQIVLQTKFKCNVERIDANLMSLIYDVENISDTK